MVPREPVSFVFPRVLMFPSTLSPRLAFGRPPTPDASEPLYSFLSHGPTCDVQDIREIIASSCSAYFTTLQGSELLPNEQYVLFEFNHLAASSVVVWPMETGAKIFSIILLQKTLLKISLCNTINCFSL